VLAGRRTITSQMADRLSQAWKIPRELLGPRSSATRKRRIVKGATALALVFATVFGSAGAYHAWALRDLPSVAPLLAAREAPEFVTLEEVPAHVRQAFLAAEDSDFYAHNGTSARGLARATVISTLNALRGRRPSGGGTITHQLVKGTLLAGEPRSLRRRLREIALGVRLEAALAKDRATKAI
jgi:penicillin-binding protein 1A